MTKVKKQLCVLLTLWSSCWLGCASRFSRFTVRRIVSAEASDPGQDGFRLQVRCEIENPNPVTARVKEATFRVSLEGHDLGTGLVSAPLILPARGRRIIAVTMPIAYRDIPADLPELASRGFLPLEVVARVKASTRFGEHDLVLKSRGRVSLVSNMAAVVRGAFDADTIRVKRVQVLKLSLGGVRIQQ